MSHLPLPLLAVFALLSALSPAANAGEALIEPAALRADLDQALREVRARHPALDQVADIAALDAEAARIRRSIDRPVSRVGAWALLARLNPHFGDGHTVLGLPGWRGEAARLMASGQGLFPFEVELDRHGVPRIAGALGGGPHPLSGARIRRINGEDAREIAAAMLARAHGDTPRMRRALVSERWWFFYAMLHGTPSRFDLRIGDARPDRLTIAAASVLPAAIDRENDFDANFRCQTAADGRALLVLGSFGWPDKPRVLALTRDCFARLRAAGTTRLLIDVSANGGGDDDLWFDGVMPYVATRPWRNGSTYLKRVTADDPAKGEVAGTIVAGENGLREAPPADESLAYRGDIELRIGPMTYSSAILFANVMRDYGLARLCGDGDAARTRQTGGTRTLTLPASGLFLSYPRFILDAPAGDKAPALLGTDGPCTFAASGG
ncbi:MAG: S41 family peptidase [Sphingomonadaceae bacterium]|nr:S41 family peptidase [Sphingomonadaceae bacterium]